MFEIEVYLKAVESAQAWAVRENEQARASRLELVARWFTNADIARAKGEPLPPQPPTPAPVVSIVAPEGSYDQGKIEIRFGPGYVADPDPLVLPPIKGYAVTDFPPGVCAPGFDYGDTMAALPQDTMANGTRIEHNGKKWEKVEGFWPFGRKSFYRLVA